MINGTAGVVVLGSGLAGYSLAREIRKLDKQMAITIVTADDGEVYSKPMLSNALIQGKTSDGLIQKSATAFGSEFGIAVHTRQRVIAIDRIDQRVTVVRQDGTHNELPYGKLVLAIGADPRPCAVAGAAPGQIRTVNDLADYRLWIGDLAPKQKILLIGAGLVGCEFANDLASAGFGVAMVDPAPWPLGRLLPEELGHALAQALRETGVALHLARSVVHIEGQMAVLDDGTTILFDHILSAIGLVPRTQLAQKAGLAVARGITVDRFLQTSDANIHALGDCAETSAGPLPFVLPLMAQARALAATLAGQPTPLVMPAMPVVVKTPCLPLAVCPPKANATGEWRVTGSGQNRKALFTTDRGDISGFALAGDFAKERQALGKVMPPLIAETD